MLHQADFPFGNADATPPRFEPHSLDVLIKPLSLARTKINKKCTEDGEEYRFPTKE